MDWLFWALRVCGVIVLLWLAAYVATPPGRASLPLRGLARVLRKDSGVSGEEPPLRVSWTRRFIAFLIVLVAVLMATIVV